MKEYFEKHPESLPYLNRLVEEWRKYGKIIVATDYDDTISEWNMKSADFTRIINVLKTAKETGAHLVVFTSCNKDRYPEIYDYCRKVGLWIDAINQTPIDLPYGSNGKVYANIFIDDRAGLNEAIAILEHAMYIIRGERANQNITDAA
jgi:pimeloyl-CoA synthetase